MPIKESDRLVRAAFGASVIPDGVAAP